MATGGGPFEEVMHDQDLPNWSNESVDDRLNNMVRYLTEGGLLLTTNVVRISHQLYSPKLQKLQANIRRDSVLLIIG